METISLLFKILFWIFSALTIAGMIKPWWVLWFLDFNNRYTVLRYYGLAALLFGSCILLIDQIGIM